MIRRRFLLEIPVFVIAQDDLANILSHAPDRWGTDGKAVYDNPIFLLPPLTAADVCKELGEPKEGLEQIQNDCGAIFWSFDRKNYQKTNWWSKTASSAVSSKLTIRTAATVRKLAQRK